MIKSAVYPQYTHAHRHVLTPIHPSTYTPVSRYTPRVKTILAPPMGIMINILICSKFSILTVYPTTHKVNDEHVDGNYHT